MWPDNMDKVPQDSDRGSEHELRPFLIGFGLGGVCGVCFGGLLAWWFGGGNSAVAMILIFHAAFAGGAMGGWVIPTLVSEELP